MVPLVSNRAKEDAAIAWVLKLEQAAGRQAVDARYRDAPADIESDERLIEVKAFGGKARGADLWLETRQVSAARGQPDRFFLYLVENVAQGDPGLFELRVLSGDQLRRLLERAREKHYFELPLPVAEYDAAPREA